MDKQIKKLKKIILTLALLLVLMGGILFAFRFVRQKEEPQQPSNLTALMGTYPETKEVLSEEEIRNAQINYESIFSIEDKEDIPEVILVFLNSLEWGEDTPFYRENGCYISKKPLRFFSADTCEMCTEERLLAFSKDFGEAIEIYLYYNEHSDEMNVQLTYSVDAAIMDAFTEAPDEKYIFLYNGRFVQILDSHNILHSGSIDNDITVEGDYYHALDYEKIAVSYQDIISEENLIWVNF